MPTLLRIDSSADLQSSRTRALTAAVAEAWESRGSEYTVVTRDVHVDPLPHLSTVALHWPEPLRGGEQIAPEAEQLQRDVLDELLAADALVIGAPMYNYSLPSTLKAWIDLVHVPGVTAPFGDETRPLRGRPAVIVTARGASYDPGSPTAGWDHVVPPLQIVLGEAFGMDVSVVATSRTLADRIPALDPARAAEEFAAAHLEASRLGATI